AGLERLPPRPVSYRGATLRELDLDAALARRPAVLLVDELAHTNVPGSRHAKRWQDVEELLEAGISVSSTLNVQHVESLNDLVAKVTGVAVRETVPDGVVDKADELKLVDLPPDDLLQRLAEGKVYMPEQAERAIDSFFRKGNLIALRELALRRTAERVDEQMRVYRDTHGVRAPWPVAERLVVGVGASPAAARLVRAARRLAANLRAEWAVVHVETPRSLRAPQEDRDRLQQTLRLAARLGAEVLTVSGESFADELVRLAHDRNASKIVVGRPTHPSSRDRLAGSETDRLLRRSHGIDVWVIAGEGDEIVAGAARAAPRARRGRPAPREWIEMLAAIATATTLCVLLAPYLREANLIMLYLIAIVFVSLRCRRRVSAVAAALSALAFDFFFVPPHFSFAIADSEYLITFAGVLATGLTISTLASHLKDQLGAARDRERRTQALYSLSRDLQSAEDLDEVLQAAVRRVHEVFRCHVFVLLPGPAGELEARASDTTDYRMNEREMAVADWVFAHGSLAGRGSDTLPAALGLYLPLRTSAGLRGVLGLHGLANEDFAAPLELRFLEAFCGQVAVAIERRSAALD
ncbi:MAG: DUF4118 domain-containing protein, partial [Acidobacteriota bacterium]